ncbi:MAG TPA: hypothetical protein VNY27_08415 [Solirubrobacteraceae bacterium]|jgi:hypothetical protein|nr:hypothetical protein [Solirubrobacteraceae bacterium]
MTKKPERRRDTRDARPRRIRKDVWDDAEIVVNIGYTKPGTALDDHLRKEQTRALLDLLADYVQKLDEKNDAGP